MILKDIVAGTANWLRSHRFVPLRDRQPEVDEEGLLTDYLEFDKGEQNTANTQGETVVVKTIQPADRRESLQKMQESFDKLVGQLQAINKNLDKQLVQQEDLAARVREVPALLGCFPSIVEDQKKVTQELLDQLKLTVAKDQQFVEAVERIPAETSRQTGVLANINHQLTAAAATDVQMVEGVNKFNEVLNKLNHSTVKQTESISQMRKTFAVSDRYLKYLITKQNRRIVWMFVTTVIVCVVAVAILTGVIIYVKR